MRRVGPLVCVLAACSSRAPDPAIPATSTAFAIGAGLTPVSIERGVPQLLVAGPAYRTPRSPLDHVASLAPAWNVRELPQLTAIGAIAVRGGTITRVRQELDGLPIDRSELRVLTRPDGELVALAGTLVDRDTPRRPQLFALSDTAAVATAIGGDAAGLVRGARWIAGRSGALDVPLADARRAWVRHDGGLVAAWVVEAYVGPRDSTQGDLIHAVVTGDGRVLERQSLVADGTFAYRVFADPAGEHRPFDGPIADVSPHPTGVPDGNYPDFVASQLFSVEGLNHPGGPPDPWLVTGRTETGGNNVDAYVDLNAPSGLTFGDFRATVTSAGVFDRSYDPTQDPLATQDQQMAAVTSLFYVTNWLHDFWYDAGFVESAGNAQDNNFGRGGEDRDALLAEAQDNALGGSRNNANMSTPADGLPPRMQVFLWSGVDERALSLQPSGRTPDTTGASYGVVVFDVTAEVALAEDGSGADTHDLCEAPTTDVTGKIVLVHRGNCTFESKALRIQTAGGVGMIVENNVANPPPTMGDDSTLTEPITIGQLAILQSEGQAIETELAAGTVTATMHRLKGPELEGAVDSALIAHEYGHYVHHRLQQCNTRMCAALSEGWGDFDALMTMLRQGDDLDGAYPIAVYATRSFSADAEYFGIRRAPYSVNLAINALRFGHMAAGATLPTTHPFLDFGAPNEVHNAGEIWAEVLWEAYVALQREHGFDDARARMASYIVTGLMIAPVDATPTETRDAILIAARTSSESDHAALAAAFARRGFGSCAVSPPRLSVDFAGIVESDEVRAHLVIAPPIVAAFAACDNDDVIDTGETGRVVLAISNDGAKPLVAAPLSVTSPTPGVRITNAPATIDLAPYTTATIAIDVALDDATTPLAGDFDIAIAGDACGTTSVTATARLNVDDVPASSATDTFDTADSVWNGAPTWHHIRESALDGAWHGDAPPFVSEAAIVTPPLTAGTDPVTLTFTHRYAFETSATAPFDGGVVEFSVNDGMSWSEIGTLDPSIPYGTTPIDGLGNPLRGRIAFTGTLSEPQTVTLNLGTHLAGMTFRIRFLIGTDQSVASPGWDIDDVAFTGLVDTPFPAQVADRKDCAGPTSMPPDAGGAEPPVDGGCCDASNSPSGLMLGLGVLALLRRRRSSQRHDSRPEAW